MPLSFPGNPTLYQSHFTGGRTWLYNGSGWITDVAPVANLQAITTNIVPGANVTYDIGSSSRRWRDLYLSGNTIDLGGTAIKSTANGVSFTNAANAAASVPLSVSSIQLVSAGNVVTLRASSTGLETVSNVGNAVPIGGATVTVANTIPTTTNEGSMWLDSDTGDLRVYFGGNWAGVGFGPQGATGPQGTAGAPGSNGATGATGSAGSNGATGATGPAGSPGTNGSSIVITTVTYPNSASAANVAGGELITVSGSGFIANALIFVDKTQCNTSNLTSTSLTFVSPANSVGYYHLFLYNVNGSSTVKPIGMFYSNIPSWVTNAGALSPAVLNSNYSVNLVATGDAPITYSQASGTLPTGLTLAANGLIAGTATGSVQNYSFAVDAIDVENQRTRREFTIQTSSIYSLDYLVVGGGGSAGQTLGGGGGGGGVISGTLSSVNVGQNFAVTVGAGGATNSSGTASSFSTYTAAGGGFGGSTTGYHPAGPGSAGGSGGSGGGGAGCDNAAGPCGGGGTGNTPSATPSQGNSGGPGGGGSSYNGAGGGGGGAAAAGSGAASGQQGGNGGNGREWPTGSGTYYGGGGGGNSRYDRGAAGTSGGLGGGGANNSGTGNPGTANTGGGAGAGNSGSTSNGGSGVVIIRYLGAQRGTGGTVTSAGGYTYHTFTVSGTYTS